MKTAIAIVAALLILGLIAWFAVSAALGNNGWQYCQYETSTKGATP